MGNGTACRAGAGAANASPLGAPVVPPEGGRMYVAWSLFGCGRRRPIDSHVRFHQMIFKFKYYADYADMAESSGLDRGLNRT